jgi:DNA repair photolyase
VFATLEGVPPTRSTDGIRWTLADEEDAGALFPDERQATRHVGTGLYRGLEFLQVNAKTIINRVPGDTLGFNYTINPYRGCSHACTYCFARPTHDYLGLGIGRDFEQKIVVKINAVERLRAELAAPKWQGDLIAMGTNTDPYQPAEGKYHLTQGIIGVLAEAENPFSILTKSTLVLRDLERLVAASKRTSVRLDFSIGSLDREVWRSTEPGTPPPERRMDAVRRLNEAGIPCGVLVAPILPGLSDRDEQITAVVQAAVDAGARSVTGIPLHLRPGVKEHYLSWLAEAHPSLVERHEGLFARGAYQPKAERERIARLVRGVVPPSSPASEPRRRGRMEQREPEQPDPVPAPEGGISVQLRLVP